MRTKNTFTILFWADLQRAKNEQALLYARVTVNKKRVNVSLKRRLKSSLWDRKAKRAKGSSKESREINQYLDQMHSLLFQCYQELLMKNDMVTADLVKATFHGETENTKTLQQLIDYHNRKSERILSAGTMRNFEVTQGYILKFLQNDLRTDNIFLRKLDYAFLCDFERYLYSYYPKGHPKAMSQNTVMKHIQRFRKMVTMAFHLEWIDKDPFMRFKMSYEKREREFLSEIELKVLEDYYLESDRLERVRDIFVFSCYTGICYSDLMMLTPDHIQKSVDGYNWIVTKRIKTNTAVRVPLLDKAQEIIDKYSDHPITQVTGYLLPGITNQKVNLYLKEIAEICEIKKNLTFHMARHTFATTVTLTNGVPIETVSKLLGHTKIATTQIYARVLRKKISEDMMGLNEKLRNKNKEDISLEKRMEG